MVARPGGQSHCLTCVYGCHLFASCGTRVNYLWNQRTASTKALHGQYDVELLINRAHLLNARTIDEPESAVASGLQQLSKVSICPRQQHAALRHVEDKEYSELAVFLRSAKGHASAKILACGIGHARIALLWEVPPNPLLHSDGVPRVRVKALVEAVRAEKHLTKAEKLPGCQPLSRCRTRCQYLLDFKVLAGTHAQGWIVAQDLCS
mmetsp:Transcript_13953/g.33180  ORF Transcript_13953/g.33180 Transcript_13953/m.33180 type:complete len:207 (-) Transcript_13953:217-837(-)